MTCHLKIKYKLCIQIPFKYKSNLLSQFYLLLFLWITTLHECTWNILYINFPTYIFPILFLVTDYKTITLSSNVRLDITLVIKFGIWCCWQLLLMLLKIFNVLKHIPHSITSTLSILIVGFFEHRFLDPCTAMLPLQHLTEHIAYNRCKINICIINRYINELITNNYQGFFLYFM